MEKAKLEVTGKYLFRRGYKGESFNWLEFKGNAEALEMFKGFAQDQDNSNKEACELVVESLENGPGYGVVLSSKMWQALEEGAPNDAGSMEGTSLWWLVDTLELNYIDNAREYNPAAQEWMNSEEFREWIKLKKQ